jgi:hypothetical protein
LELTGVKLWVFQNDRPTLGFDQPGNLTNLGHRDIRLRMKKHHICCHELAGAQQSESSG